MISIPIWVFVIMVIFAGLMFVEIFLIIGFIIISSLTPEYDYGKLYCPDELDPDYNPEYIPKVEREKDDE